MLKLWIRLTPINYLLRWYRRTIDKNILVQSGFRPNFFWSVLSEQFGETLAATSLDSLCRQAARAELPRAQSEGPMYFI